MSACAPGRFPGAWVEKWIFCRPSTSPQVSPVSCTSSRIDSPSNEGASRWWKTSNTTGTPSRSASGNTTLSGCRSSFSRTRRERVPSLRRAKLASKRSADPTCRTILWDGPSPNASSRRLWYSSSATAASTTLGFTEERTVYCPGCVDSRPARAPISANRSPNSSHQAIRFTGCDPNGIRFDVTRNTSMPCSAFQRRIASNASRLAAISSRRRSGVAFARRTVRPEEGSPVLTHAYPSRRPPSWTGAFVQRAGPGTATSRAESGRGSRRG